MADFTRFRTAVGGFHRADVTDYIETLCAEHKQVLKKKEEEAAILADRLAAAQQALDAKATEADLLQKKLAETELALSSTESALEEALVMIEEQDALHAAQEEEEDDPDYTAMELEAYRRAEATERLAAERASKLRMELSNLLDTVSGRYEQTGQEIQALSMDIHTNLQRLQEALSDLEVIFDEANDSFNIIDAEPEEEPEEE